MTPFFGSDILSISGIAIDTIKACRSCLTRDLLALYSAACSTTAHERAGSTGLRKLLCAKPQSLAVLLPAGSGPPNFTEAEEASWTANVERIRQFASLSGSLSLRSIMPDSQVAV